MSFMIALRAVHEVEFSREDSGDWGQQQRTCGSNQENENVDLIPERHFNW